MLSEKCYKYPRGEVQIENETIGYGLPLFQIDLKGGVQNGYMESHPSPDGLSTVYTIIPKDGKLFFPIAGAEFPYKSCPVREGVFQFNMVKSLLVDIFGLSKLAILPIVFSNKQRLVDTFNRFAFRVTSEHLIKEEYLTDFCAELYKFISVFMVKLGITKESAERFAIIIANMFEYDNAYRLRAEDIITETSKEKLSNPYREISRLISILKTRRGFKRKFGVILYFASVLLIIPKIRKAFCDTINEIDLDKMKLDTIDTYWVCQRADNYRFMGLDDDERLEYLKNKGWVTPSVVI